MTLRRYAAHPRVTIRTPGAPDPDGVAVVYWMQRAQRALDNPALDAAIAVANLVGKPVVVFFGLNPFVARANVRHYQFLAEGLADIAEGLAAKRVGFVLRRHPHHRLEPFLAEVRPALVISDENPLRQMERWREAVAERLLVPFWTVDADVVVPTKLIESEQYAARTIRPRIHKHLDALLVPPPEPVAEQPWQPPRDMHNQPATPAILEGLPIDGSVGAVETFRGGTRAGLERLGRFVRSGLAAYGTTRNHPEVDGTSQLSPYLHFGHLGPRAVALAARQSGQPAASVDAFIEQVVVRRELAVNYVRYNPQYDRLDGCEPWARQTLRRHQPDPRTDTYDKAAFEHAQTHDPLWNAAQRQMVDTGWMHNYVRMYWAKKILEWSRDAETAFDIAVELNDRYEVDGRDPNGYTNIAWAIGGKHDRPWPQRPVYGTIRSMAFDRTRKKFDAAAYVAQFGSTRDIDLFRALTRAKRR